METAYVLVHGHEHCVDEKEVVEFLSDQEDVFYVSDSDGFADRQRSFLPPGFDTVDYRRGLEEERSGILVEDEQEFLEQKYDQLVFLGAKLERCLGNASRAFSDRDVEVEKDLERSYSSDAYNPLRDLLEVT